MEDLIPIMTDTRGQPGKHLAVAGIYDSEGLCLQNKNPGRLAMRALRPQS
jgi:hypothetical protein